MAVNKTDTTIFQANLSKLSKPVDVVNLEELPDSRKPTKVPVLMISCEGQKDVWENFL